MPSAGLPVMRCILAFGDSLTWGEDPETGHRHRYEDRWPTVLQAELAGDLRVIAEGLGGRTTAFDDLTGPCERNGVRSLPMLLGSHMPIDLLIVMLGTNDLKPFLAGTARGAQMGIKRLIQVARSYPYRAGHPVPQILVVSPPHVRASRSGQPAQDRSITESQALSVLYRQAAVETGCAHFDAATVAEASPVDGVHLDAAATRALGHALVSPVRAMLGL